MLCNNRMGAKDTMEQQQKHRYTERSFAVWWSLRRMWDCFQEEWKFYLPASCCYLATYWPTTQVIMHFLTFLSWTREDPMSSCCSSCSRSGTVNCERSSPSICLYVEGGGGRDGQVGEGRKEELQFFSVLRHSRMLQNHPNQKCCKKFQLQK